MVFFCCLSLFKLSGFILLFRYLVQIIDDKSNPKWSQMGITCTQIIILFQIGFFLAAFDFFLRIHIMQMWSPWFFTWGNFHWFSPSGLYFYFLFRFAKTKYKREACYFYFECYTTFPFMIWWKNWATIHISIPIRYDVISPDIYNWAEKLH